jgi:hypothetical protein
MPVFEDWTRVQWWLFHTYAAGKKHNITHFSAFPDGASEEKRRSFTQYVEKLAENFPCGTCGVHLRKYLQVTSTCF